MAPHGENENYMHNSYFTVNDVNISVLKCQKLAYVPIVQTQMHSCLELLDLMQECYKTPYLVLSCLLFGSGLTRLSY